MKQNTELIKIGQLAVDHYKIRKEVSRLKELRGSVCNGDFGETPCYIECRNGDILKSEMCETCNNYAEHSSLMYPLSNKGGAIRREQIRLIKQILNTEK